MQPAALAAAMLSNPDFFGTPVPVSDEQADKNLAAWQIGRTVRMILADPSPDTITNPEQLFDDIDAIRADLHNPKLLHMASVLQMICVTLTMDRAGARA